MTFRVGQRVVCVKVCGPADAELGLVKGRIYTISGYGKFLRTFLYDVAEIKTSAPHAWGGDQFRAIVERKTDISFAHEILRKATKPAPAVSMSLHHSKCD